MGVAIGPAGFDLLPAVILAQYDLIASVALTMVAFILGGALSLNQLKNHGREILGISIIVVVITIFVVFGGLFLLGVAPVIAMLLAGIATATDPAATEDVIRHSGTKNRFTETLKGIVAIDDAWGLIAFSTILAFSSFLIGNGLYDSITDGLWDLFGAVGVGVVIGVPAAFLSGRLRPGEPMQTEALAIVFLCAGIALWLNVSYLLAGIVAGAIVVNFASHHTRAFHEIENVEWPFMVIFFLLAGSKLYATNWTDYGLLVAAYIVLLTVARIAGGWLGGKISGAPQNMRNWIGAALLPQAGIALGMALIAGSYFPEFQEAILNVAIITTIIFEVLGPIATQIAILKNERSKSSEPA
jgi:Kef-type K+ transport system membrane component KefB